MTFKHFDNPEVLSGYLYNKTSCDICEQKKNCFDAEAFYGEDQLNAVCADCIAEGKLTDLDIFTCEGDIAELIRQLKQLNPQHSLDEIEQMAKEKTHELEKKTPKLITWQDWDWPAADGDYCKFIGYGSQQLYNKLASPGNTGKQLFESSFYYTAGMMSEPGFWNNNLPAKEIITYNDSNDYGMLFYVFKSLSSKKIITIWDSE